MQNFTIDALIYSPGWRNKKQLFELCFSVGNSKCFYSHINFLTSADYLTEEVSILIYSAKARVDPITHKKIKLQLFILMAAKIPLKRDYCVIVFVQT